MSDNYYSIARADDAARPGTACFRLRGTLDIGARSDLQEEFAKAVADPAVDALDVDMTGVTFLDSEALAGLIAGFTEARQADRRFTVAGAQGLVRRVLEVTGTLALFGGEGGVPGATAERGRPPA